MEIIDYVDFSEEALIKFGCVFCGIASYAIVHVLRYKMQPAFFTTDFFVQNKYVVLFFLYILFFAAALWINSVFKEEKQ